MRRLLFVLTLAFCTAGHAQDGDTACETDTSWIEIDVFNVVQDFSTTPVGRTGFLCEGCRELNQFPQDFVNFATNYWLHGPGTRQPRGEGILSAGDVTTNFAVCNSMGQCAQGSFTTHFTSVGLPVPEAQLNLDVNSYTVRITLPNGSQSSAVYPAGMVEQNTLPVPFNSADDGLGGGGPGLPPSNPFGGSGGGVTQPEMECWVFITRENGVIVDVTIRCYPR